MNYKKVIKSQKTRFFILKILQWLPGRLMLKLQYYIKLNRKLNLSTPTRFSEKIQLYKLYYRNLDMLQCVDKYLVRSFVEKRNSSNYLNTLYFVCDDARDINFNKLPSKFVIKTSDGGGGENVFICRDRDSLDREAVVSEINGWKNKKTSMISREWAYEGAIDSKIIVEEYLEDPLSSDMSINDFKFFCFDGKVEYLVVDRDRYSNHNRYFYDMEWNNLGVESDVQNSKLNLDQPENFVEMINLCKVLSKGFPFVRVDLYNIQGEIYFGEMTFYPWSGYVQFSPDEFDYKLGEKFNIDRNKWRLIMAKNSINL